MLLSELVEVNEKGNVANSVNFSLMDDSEINLRLCESFVFNYDAKRSDLSTIGILDRLRRSYHSRSEPHIHLMIQQYGKGKSHFAVVLANFFGKPSNSPEVQGILEQVEKSTRGQAKAIYESVRAYKERLTQHHLVICLSGDRGGDIRKQFLQVLLKTLEAEGIQDSIADRLCSEPLRYLEELDERDRQKAEAYLESLGNPDGDVNSLIQLLKSHNPSAIRPVRNLFKEITGFYPSFHDEIDLEALLSDLLDRLCLSENPRFAGILILFDEMNYYLQSWAADQIGAGGTALQNITNICERYKGKIALLSFTQVNPSLALGISPTAKESYLKLSSRLAPKESTYDGPASSLEVVLNNLLLQHEDSPEWTTFLQRWNSTLLNTARTAYEKRINFYRERGWSLDEFYQYLSKGCFPLHPLTAYLLCKLAFTQDRTAIGFIKGYVKKFIATQSVEVEEYLNYIYPIDLVDEFADNFANSPVYTRYKEASSTIGTDAPDELKALKALFLYFASDEQLTKSDREDHEDVLEALCGLSRLRLKAALAKLEKTREIIFYKPEVKLYRFWEGINPRGIEDEIEDQIRNEVSTLQSVVDYCQSHFREKIVKATHFVHQHKLIEDDWQFEIKFYTIDGLISALSSDRTLRGTEEGGILAYVLADTQEDLQDFRRRVDKDISHSPWRDRVAVAIPTKETGNLDRVLLKQQTLKSIDPDQKRLWGTTACEQLLERWREQIQKSLKDIYTSCTFHCTVIEKVPLSERNNPHRVVSALLQELYPFVPTVESIDKLRSNHGTGKTIVATVATQLFANLLSPQTLPTQQYYSTVIDTLYVNSWKILKKTSDRYIPQEPTQESIKDAWDKINQLTDLKGATEGTLELASLWSILSSPPYGYSEYNFTILLASWLAYHRREVVLKGSIKIQKKASLASSQTLPLKEWANTDILQDPKTFVQNWIQKDKAKLIRRKALQTPELPPSPLDFSQAETYLEAANNFIESSEVDPSEVEAVQRTRQKVEEACQPILEWLKPTQRAEDLSAETNLATLLELYTQLSQKPPTYRIDAEKISVRHTQEQRDRQSNAFQTISTRIERQIESVCLKAERLDNEQACEAYKTEVKNLIQELKPVANLPERWIATLEAALETRDRVLAQLKKDAKIHQDYETARAKSRELNDYSTQADFQRVIGEINAITQNIPSDRSEQAEVQCLLQALNQQYQELNQRIEAWEERASSLASHPQVVELIQEIARHRDRFTEDDSQQRLSGLQQSLERELSRIQVLDDSQSHLRTELSNAQQKLQRLRDLPDSKMTEAFQVYQDLEQAQLPSVAEETPELGDFLNRLQSFKTQGRGLIEEKFRQICDRPLTRPEEYENRKAELNRAITLLKDATQFDSIQSDLSQSLELLETQHQELLQQAEIQARENHDREIIRSIHHLRLDQSSTIQICEEKIDQIESLREKIHHSEPFQLEIENLIKSFQDHILIQQQKLEKVRVGLTQVSTLDSWKKLQLDYARLEPIFNDSSQYSTYQELQDLITSTEADLEKIEQLKNRLRQSNSIADCNSLSSEIQQVKTTLRNPNQFQALVVEIEESANQKHLQYYQTLKQLSQRLDHVVSDADAQRLRDALIKQASCFENSDVEEEFEALTQEVKLLIEVLPLISRFSTTSLDDCNDQLVKLKSWQEATEGLTERLRDRITVALQEIEKNRQKILVEKQTAARNWLQHLQSQICQMYSEVVNRKKYEIATHLLQILQEQKSIHSSFLSSADHKALVDIEQKCIEEQNKDKENRIIALFQELPRVQRKAVYEQLSKCLDVQAEEF